MNKTYRLQKTYPGSPTLGYEMKPKFLNEVNAYYWQHQYFEPSEYPEFWKEIEELKSWYGVNSKSWHTYYYENINRPLDGVEWKYFESESDRDRYIKENKPKYSEKDLFDCVKYVGAAIGSLSLGPSAVDNWIRNIKK